MKKLCIFIVVCTIVNTQLIAQNQQFSKPYGGMKYVDARSLTKTNDDCFVFTGLDKSKGDVNGDMYLTKVDANGKLIWEKTYPKPLEDGGNDILKCKDGGFLINGHEDFGDGICDAYVVKTDEFGVEEWSVYVGDTLDDAGNGVIQDEFGDYYLTGRFENPANGDEDIMFAKISETGELLFSKHIILGGFQWGRELCFDSKGDIIIVGYHVKSSRIDWLLNRTTNEDVVIAKVNRNGDLIWSKFYGNNLNERGFAITALKNGGCLVIGGTKDAENQIKNSFILKYDQNGNLTEEKQLFVNQGNSYGFDIIDLHNDTYAICGQLKETGQENGNPFVAILNKELEITEYKVIPNNNESEVRTIYPMNEEEFFMAGRSILSEDVIQGLLVRESISK